MNVGIYNEFSAKAPNGHRLNEVVHFSYPVRRVKMNVLVNKEPDSSMAKVYSVILQAIQKGLSTTKELFLFLGLSESDEFMLRELWNLRDNGYIDLISETWVITDSGIEYINDNSIMRIEEFEEFEFFVDCISGSIMPLGNSTLHKANKFLEPKLTFQNKDARLVNGKYESLSDVYRAATGGKSYLISYSSEDIVYDAVEWCNYWLLEYIPKDNNEAEAFLDVRNDDDTLSQNKELTKLFKSNYSHYVYKLGSEERVEIGKIGADEVNRLQNTELNTNRVDEADLEILSIWETKAKFKEALMSVNKRILIESPWIKRATKEYIPLFEKILSERKQLVIIYGISSIADHDFDTLNTLKLLQKEYNENFTLIDLPIYLRRRSSRLTGTHRKLVVKDDEYYIAGSFNFLSFGKDDTQLVANEESLLVRKNVQQKWDQVFKDYMIEIK